MLTVVIKDNGEERVVKYTYELLWRELKDIPGAELVVSDDWFAPVQTTKNKYICFVEADCLVNSGYFVSQMALFQKNPYFRKLAMLSSCVGVKHWVNCFYGYSLGVDFVDGIKPNRTKKSSQVYPVQVGYVPGAIVRVSMLKEALTTMKPIENSDRDLVLLSTQISLAFWKQGDGNRIHLNPNTTYVTTEDYVNDICSVDIDIEDLLTMFTKEAIS